MWVLTVRQLSCGGAEEDSGEEAADTQRRDVQVCCWHVDDVVKQPMLPQYVYWTQATHSSNYRRRCTMFFSRPVMQLKPIQSQLKTQKLYCSLRRTRSGYIDALSSSPGDVVELIWKLSTRRVRSEWDAGAVLATMWRESFKTSTAADDVLAASKQHWRALAAFDCDASRHPPRPSCTRAHPSVVTRYTLWIDSDQETRCDNSPTTPSN